MADDNGRSGDRSSGVKVGGGGPNGDGPGDGGGDAEGDGDDFEHAELSDAEREDEERSLQQPPKPFNRRTPFLMGLTGALGVAVAYVLVRTVFDLGEVLSLIGLSLFLAVGLDPAVVWLTERRMPRWVAVVLVLVAAVAFVAALVVAAVGPVSREVHQLTVDIPKWRKDVNTGHGWIGHLAKEFHLKKELASGAATKSVNLSLVGGVLGAGKVLLSAVSTVVIVIVLTIYFLVTLPAVRDFFLRFIPRSRRERGTAITDEVMSRVGGFVLGNLLTSVVAGVGTAVWLSIFGVPYPILLGLLVALLDLIPVVGSTIGGVIASLVALSVSLPVAIATAAFYVGYRFFEDYLLTPRVMRHTVRISPGITIIATLAGAVLLGLIGALIAIPTAAALQLILEEVTLPTIDRR